MRSFLRYAAASVLFSVTATAVVIRLGDLPPPPVPAVALPAPAPALGVTVPPTPPPVILRHHPGESARDPASGILRLSTGDGGGTVYVAADTRLRVVLAPDGMLQWHQASSSDARTLTPVLSQGGYPDSADAVTEYVALTPGPALLRSSAQSSCCPRLAPGASWEVVVHVVPTPEATLTAFRAVSTFVRARRVPWTAREMSSDSRIVHLAAADRPRLLREISICVR